MEERAYWVGLHSVPHVGPRTFAQLVEHCGSPQEAWLASRSRLQTVPGLQDRVIDSIIAYREAVSLERQWEQVINAGLRVITLAEPQYPALLKKTYDPPPVLFVRGNLPVEEPAVAMVGSRRATPYGRQVAESLAGELAANGLCVVSGLARGIDSCAHRGALKAGGRTVAVLGSGMDVAYPPENRRLMEEISDSGAVVTEFPLGTPPLAGNFPARNRVISGLSWGVIVVEAPEKSGAMITADFALEQGREVFAVPGPVTSLYSVGTNHLIRQGARLVMSARDVLEEFHMESLAQVGAAQVQLEPAGLSPDEKQVLELLRSIPLHVDAVVQNAGLTTSRVHAALMYLEVKGLIRQLPGKYFLAVAGN